MLFDRAVSMISGGLALCLLAGPAFAAERSSGLIFTPPDQLRGIPLASSPYAGAELPPVVDLSDRMPPAGDQGNQQSCVAFAIAYALKSYQENQELKWGFATPDHIFSPSFIYNQINNGVDGGSLFTDALNLLSSDGVPPISVMPYNEHDFRSQPTEAARAAAKKYRIDTWRQVNPQDVREVKAQLNAGYPVIVGVTVDDALLHLGAGAVWGAATGTLRGGHALLVVGYDDSKNAFKFLNSWGTAWGENGYGWIDYTFFRTEVREAFVAKDATDTAEPPPVPVAEGPNPQPPEVASAATFAVTGVEPNVIAFGLKGMTFTGTLDVPEKITGQLQIVIRVVTPNGEKGIPVKSLIPAYSTPDGYAATGTPILPLQGNPLHTTWYAFLPYETLTVPHGVRADLSAIPTLFINRFGVRDGTAIPFYVVMAAQKDETFYYNDNGKPAGPFDLATMGAKVTEGKIMPDTLVWKSGTPDWVPARQLPEIGGLIEVR